MDITATSSTSTAAQPQPAATTSLPGMDGLANEQTFLKLFVAQLRNQDPLNPQDGTQFVAQLAQFSQLEQSLQMRQDLDTIRQNLQPPASTPSPAPSATPSPATQISQ